MSTKAEKTDHEGPLECNHWSATKSFKADQGRYSDKIWEFAL